MSKLAGRVAVVTGASKGIGAAIAEELAREGAAVVVNYASSAAAAEALAAKIVAAGGRAKAICADVSQPAEGRRLIDAAVAEFGKLDILVNNAGIYEFLRLADVTEEHFDRLFNLNVRGLVFVTQAAVAAFGERGGCVITIGSVASQMAPATGSVYGATKGALEVLTRSWSAELGKKNIRVNAVLPGPVETEGSKSERVQASFERIVTYSLPRTPLGRVGQPGDIAPVVAFLASDDAAWITGEIIQAAGGLR
jgi:3-oxoacyl-[acyl-carrier protein] reductase